MQKGVSTQVDPLVVEKTTAQRRVELSNEQVRLLKRFSPELRERHIQTRHTGELVAVDTFFVGHLKGVCRKGLATDRRRLPRALCLGTPVS